MSNRSSKTKSKPRNKQRRTSVEKEAKVFVRASRGGAKSRSRRSNAELKVQGNFAKTLGAAVPAAIGSVTESTTRRHRMTVSESELVTSIVGNNTVFPVVQSRYINPGRIALFPWLGGLSVKFELYRFKKLKFRWQPTASTSETGNVAMGIDYDSLDNALTTEQQLMAIPGSKMGSVFMPFEIDALAGGKSQFAKDLFISDSSTAVTANLGRFYLMVTGTTATNSTTVGRLFVDYTVDLIISQINADGALSGPYLDGVGSGPWSSTNELAGLTLDSNSSQFGEIVDISGTRYIKLYNPGYYLCVFHWVATSLTVTDATGVISQPPSSATSVFHFVAPPSGSTAGMAIAVHKVLTDIPNCAIAPTNITSVAGSGNQVVYVVPIYDNDEDSEAKEKAKLVERLTKLEEELKNITLPSFNRRLSS